MRRLYDIFQECPLGHSKDTKDITYVFVWQACPKTAGCLTQLEPTWQTMKQHTPTNFQNPLDSNTAPTEKSWHSSTAPLILALRTQRPWEVIILPAGYWQRHSWFQNEIYNPHTHTPSLLLNQIFHSRPLQSSSPLKLKHLSHADPTPPVFFPNYVCWLVPTAHRLPLARSEPY